MANAFGATSSTEDVLSGVDLKGKRILVTGVSAGIGVETARSLVAHGAHVVGAARDLAKAEVATAQVRQEAAAHDGGLELIALDLASLASVRAAADRLVADGRLFDGIIAGQKRKLLAQASRNGWFFVVDRTTGKNLLSKPYAKQNWTLGIDEKGSPIPNPEKMAKPNGVLVAPNQANRWCKD